MEKKVQEAEMIAFRMAEEAERRTLEVEDFKREMLKAKMFEKMARDRLSEISSSSPTPRLATFADKSDGFDATHSMQNGIGIDTDKLSAEIERERWLNSNYFSVQKSGSPIDVAYVVGWNMFRKAEISRHSSMS